MKIKHWFALVYFLISWKEFRCDASCPDRSPSFGGLGIILTPSGGDTVSNGSCTIKVVTQEKRFEENQKPEMGSFVKSLHLVPITEKILEEMLEHPENLKWGFKQKKVTITEKELEP